MGLIEQLKKDGADKGLCRLWQMKLREGLDMKDLTQLYIRGIDFCISEEYPTLDFIREHFKGKCEPYGVYVDDEVGQLKNVPDVVLNGDCKAMLEYDGYTVSRVFVRHGSKAAINVGDNAHVTVDIFDNSDVVIATAGHEAKVIVKVYGNAKLETIGEGIIVRFTNNKTY